MFRVGQRVRVVSHAGYKKYETSEANHAPEINKTYIVDEVYNYSEICDVLFFNSVGRGIYAEDCVDATTKLEKAMK